MLKNSILLVSLFFMSLPAWSTIYRINDSANQDINRHSVCVNVQNNNCDGAGIMVPTGNSTEWSNFRSNAPACAQQCSCNYGNLCTSNPGAGGCAYSCSHFSGSWCIGGGQFGVSSSSGCVSDPVLCPYANTIKCFVCCYGYGTFGCNGFSCS